MTEFQLKVCLAYLQQITTVGFIDMFDICNIYVLEDYEKIWDDNLLTELLAYSRIHLITQFGHTESHHLRSRRAQSSDRLSDRFSDRFSESLEMNSDRVELSDLRQLLSLFHINISLGQIIQHPYFIRLKNIIDIHRFVVFACIHHLLRRVYLYPVLTRDATAFHTQFVNTVAPCSCTTHLAESQTPPAHIPTPIPAPSVEYIGLSMDGQSNHASSILLKQGLEGEGEGNQSDPPSKELDISGLYKSLLEACKHSLYHSSQEKNGLSRHSSCLSFGKEMMKAAACTCKVDEKKAKKMLDNHECLEYMALHLDCCIPAVMQTLEAGGNVIYLKK